MLAFYGEAILHSFVAALVVEALLRLWRVHDPREKVRYRLLTLAMPLVALPVFWLTPARAAPGFVDHLAIFSSQSWQAVRLGSISLYGLGFFGLGTAGALLFAVDVWPFVRERLRETTLEQRRAPAPERLVGLVHQLCAPMGVRAPEVRFCQSEAPLLHCAGAHRPALVVSSGTLAALDDAELRCALAHELAHLQYRDVLLSWILLAGRTVQLINPVVHVLVRAVARDAERRADDRAHEVTGDRLALASGMIKLFKLTQGGQGVNEPIWGPFVSRARTAAIEERCRRLIDRRPSTRPPLPALHLAWTAMTLAALLFFVM